MKRPLKLPDGLGKIIPVAGIVHNPTHEWLGAVYRFHNPEEQRRNGKEVPYYGGSPIEAVLMIGGDLADPRTGAAISYRYIHWPNDTTVLRVFELEDGTLWEEMTDTEPVSLDFGLSIIRNQSWQDDWLLSNRARQCVKLIGPHVQRLHFLKSMSAKGLKLHKSRLPV